MTTEREQYTMGYGPAATMIMGLRTAQAHAAFFLPHLKPGMNLLDCGCGPGTITLSVSQVVSPGNVVELKLRNTGRRGAAECRQSQRFQCAF